MRRHLFFALLALAGCSSDPTLEYDFEPILLARAPVLPGGAALGGLLAKVDTATGVQALVIDSAFPFDSLATTGCPNSATPGWTYTGTMNVRDGSDPAAPLRASLQNVGLFDICPGPIGDAATQPAGVMGSPLLANFAVDLVLPASATDIAQMSLWPSFPGTDDQLAPDGLVPLHFEPRGGGTVAQANGDNAVTLPDTRIVLAACAAPNAFATTDAQQTCAQGEVALKASGEDLLLAVGTGEGPLILSQPAWARLAAQLGMAADAGAAGQLYTPFSTTPTSARFLTLPSLAIFQGTTDTNWIGACAELARARRIEWVLASPEPGACFQPCDASNGQAVATYPYLELGGPLDVAVIDETSSVMQALNVDVDTSPQVDGIVGAATLAGTHLRLDYPNTRVVASCIDPGNRDACFAAPGCPGASAQNLLCFGQPTRPSAPVCP
jgi:hypothetical protein